MLRRVLLAFSIHNRTISYCQSMNFLCALCLLFMEEEDSFWMLVMICENFTQVPSPNPNAEVGQTNLLLDLNSDSNQILYYHQSDLAGVYLTTQ